VPNGVTSALATLTIDPLPPYTTAGLTTAGMSPSGVPWQIERGDVLIVDVGTGQPAPQEHMVVTNVTATTVQGVFHQSHTAPAPGPGAPQQGYPVQLTKTGDRIPGKINLNTMADQRTFRALCDAQPSNSFYGGPPPASDSVVDGIYGSIISSRTKGLGGTPSATDVPFMSFAVGTSSPTDPQYKSFGGIGVNTTIGRGSGGTLTLQNSGPTNPYQKDELLTKIFNSVTTRSNVFAVWVTVGFFEVIDDTARPVKLGAEIGRNENRHIRHRMFAIVDRTNLTVPSRATVLLDPVPVPPPGGTIRRTVRVQNLNCSVVAPGTDPPLAWNWKIQTGSNLVIDAGGVAPNAEDRIVVVAVDESVNPPTITADFSQRHGAGRPITFTGAAVPPLFRPTNTPVVPLPGNVGPQPRFDPKANTALVPHYSIID